MCSCFATEIMYESDVNYNCVCRSVAKDFCILLLAHICTFFPIKTMFGDNFI